MPLLPPPPPPPRRWLWRIGWATGEVSVGVLCGVAVGGGVLEARGSTKRGRRRRMLLLLVRVTITAGAAMRRLGLESTVGDAPFACTAAVVGVADGCRRWERTSGPAEEERRGPLSLPRATRAACTGACEGRPFSLAAGDVPPLAAARPDFGAGLPLGLPLEVAWIDCRGVTKSAWYGTCTCTSAAGDAGGEAGEIGAATSTADSAAATAGADTSTGIASASDMTADLCYASVRGQRNTGERERVCGCVRGAVGGYAHGR